MARPLLLYEAIPLHAARRVAVATKGFLIVGLLVLSTSSVQAIECRELPAHRNGHWTYRMIDGRKCWYPGKNMISKSLLYWRVSNIAPKKATAVTALPSTLKTDIDLVTCCSPQLDDVAENFEYDGKAFSERCCHERCSIQFPYSSGRSKNRRMPATLPRLTVPSATGPVVRFAKTKLSEWALRLLRLAKVGKDDPECLLGLPGKGICAV